MAKISKGNRKMGNILSVSLPPITTCIKNAPCAKDCYAMKAYRMYKNTKNAYDYNLNEYLTDKEMYKYSIMSQLPLYGVFRWHVSGDIVDSDYFAMMVEIAKTYKNIKFLAFTKKYSIVNDFLNDGNKWPSNLKVVYSAWPTLAMDNPYNLPVAYMRDQNNLDDRIPKGVIPCNGDCSKCMACWNMRKRQSVVFDKH